MKKYADMILGGALSLVGVKLILLLGAAALFVIGVARELGATDTQMWILSISVLFLAIVVGLYSYSLARARLKNYEIGQKIAADAAESKRRTSGAWTSEDIRSAIAHTPPPDPNDPVDPRAFDTDLGTH